MLALYKLIIIIVYIVAWNSEGKHSNPARLLGNAIDNYYHLLGKRKPIIKDRFRLTAFITFSFYHSNQIDKNPD